MYTANASEIKLDRTFLADLPGSEQHRAILRSVIGLGHSFGCVVTAECVETQEVADALVEAGCDHAQGYLWLRPGPWTEVARAFGHPTTTTASAGAPSETQPAKPRESSPGAGCEPAQAGQEIGSVST
jgi:predicted signal transduction protein with EAL and GGDEF domain